MVYWALWTTFFRSDTFIALVSDESIDAKAAGNTLQSASLILTHVGACDGTRRSTLRVHLVRPAGACLRTLLRRHAYVFIIEQQSLFAEAARPAEAVADAALGSVRAAGVSAGGDALVVLLVGSALGVLLHVAELLLHTLAVAPEHQTRFAEAARAALGRAGVRGVAPVLAVRHALVVPLPQPTAFSWAFFGLYTFTVFVHHQMIFAEASGHAVLFAVRFYGIVRHTGTLARGNAFVILLIIWTILRTFLRFNAFIELISDESIAAKTAWNALHSAHLVLSKI